MSNLPIYVDRSRFIDYANFLLILYAFFLPIYPKVSSILMIGIVFFTLTAYDLKKRFYTAISNKIVIAFLLFYSMHVFWLFGSENIEAALLKLKDFKYILYILPFAMTLRSNYIGTVINGFLSGIFFSVLMSFAMLVDFPAIALLGLNPHVYPTFAVPFMLSYTQYGTILGLSAGLSLFMLLSGFSKPSLRIRFFYTISFILISVNIIIVPSRMGYLIYIVSVATILLYLYRQYWYTVIFGILLAFTILFTAAHECSPTFKERINILWNDIQALRENNLATSLGIRTGYYTYAFSAIRENIIWGVGACDHADIVSEKIVQIETDQTNLDALLYAMKGGHNTSLESEYLDITLQFGLLGLLVFLNLFYQLLRDKKSPAALKGFQVLLITTMMSLSTGSVIFITADIGKIFILLTALTLSIQKSDTI